MGKPKSSIPDLLRSKGWSKQYFTGQCMVAGLSYDTARRLAKGDTQFTVDTLATVARVLGVSSISELVDFDGH